MKLLGSFLLLILLTSCGKNAFLESKNGVESIRRGVEGGDGDGDGDGDTDVTTCVSELFTSNPIKRIFTKGEQPFYFKRIRIGEHNDHIVTGQGIVRSANFAQVVLDYDLSRLNKIDKKVKSIKLRLTSKQYVRDVEMISHESQICHNQNYMCSGDRDSVKNHIRNGAYEWINDDFSRMVNTFDLNNTNRGFSERTVDTSYNLMSMFKAYSNGELSTKDFINEYTIFISDRHLVTKARLNILYCR
jgi:hypothetical protein